LGFEYDVKVVVPLLMMCFERLNPTTITFVIIVDFVGPKFELEENMFNMGPQLRNLLK
jgi:hypothetical protein